VEVGAAAEVAVLQGQVFGFGFEEGAIETVFEDRSDRTDRARLDHGAARAGSLQPRLAVGLLQPEDAQAGAEALLGMGAIGHHRLQERLGRRPDATGRGHHPRRRPFGMAAVRAGHMLGDRRVAAPARRLRVAGNTLPLMEDLDHMVGDADIDQFADQPIRRRVPAAAHLDMIVRGDPAALPHRERIGLGRQRLERRRIDRREQFSPAGAVAAHDPGVQIADQLVNRRVEIDQREEALVAQLRQHPALGQQHRLFNPRLRGGRLFALSRGLYGRAGTIAVP